MTRVLLALLILSAAVVLACGDDDSDSTPSGTATSDTTEPDGDTGSPVDTAEPTPGVTADPTLAAQLVTEAAEHCPEEDLRACSQRYVTFALGDDPMALCTDDAGRWYFEPPEGSIGDSCGGSSTIVAIVGGED